MNMTTTTSETDKSKTSYYITIDLPKDFDVKSANNVRKDLEGFLENRKHYYYYNNKSEYNVQPISVKVVTCITNIN